jgi:hypothetical protein
MNTYGTLKIGTKMECYGISGEVISVDGGIVKIHWENAATKSFSASDEIDRNYTIVK